jgi:hypothetical protein
LDSHLAKLEDIEIIRNFGRGKMSNTEKVPSTVSFSKALEGEEQWGFDIGEDATVMVHTKLELDEQLFIEDELDSILYNLEGMKDLSFDAVIKGGALPDYPVQSPEEIVEHYMLKVYDVVNQRLEQLDDAEMRHTIPVDIVFTVPLVFISDASKYIVDFKSRNGLMPPKMLRIRL